MSLTDFTGGIFCYSPDGRSIASSHNATVSFWDLATNEVTNNAIEIFPPYERMNISDVKGLTAATITSLKVLGAIDRD